jgi:hypothetical protein
MSPNTARGLAAVAIGGFATLGLASPVQAATGPCPPGTYPPGATCTTGSGATTSAQTVRPGDPLTLTVRGYAKSARILVQLHSTAVTLGSMTANTQGVATGTFTIPSSTAPGTYTVTASGRGADGSTRVVAVPITIVAPTAGAGDTLSFTGFEMGAAALLGVGLIGAGTVAVVTGRKRKATFAA